MPARVLMATLLGLLLGGLAHAQTAEPIHCRQRDFRIPFQIEPGDQARLREVQLYVSEDQGLNWRHAKSVGPTERQFPFRTDRDGLYWFTVRTLDIENRHYPPSIEGSKPGLVVIVDTQPPTAALRSLPQRGEQVGVEWEVRDENLSLQSLQIDYRTQGNDWQTLTIDAQAAGQKYWIPPVRGPVEVRLKVKDRAENVGTAQLFLTQVAAAMPDPKREVAADPIQPKPPPRGMVPAGPNVKVINTTKITLNYSLEDVGPSGVSLVELWYTLDGRTWQRYGEDPDKASPFIMEVNGEGTYGLTLVVRSGAGLGDKPPQLDDPPQMWMEVDTTRPNVQQYIPEVGRGSEAGKLTLTWTASDKNLSSQPISLFYAEQPEGPWHPIATGLENNGKFVWRVPPNAPYRFFTRVEAHDRGGNIARADTAKPVVVDLAQPKGRLLGVSGDK